MLKIDWSKILTNALSVLVATIVVGAALYVWRGVESVDFRIGENFGKVQKTQKHIEAAVDVLAPQVDVNKNDIKQLKISNFFKKKFFQKNEIFSKKMRLFPKK